MTLEQVAAWSGSRWKTILFSASLMARAWHVVLESSCIDSMYALFRTEALLMERTIIVRHLVSL